MFEIKKLTHMYEKPIAKSHWISIEYFNSQTGAKQGCSLSTRLLNIVLEVLATATRKGEGEVEIYLVFIPISDIELLKTFDFI